MKFDPESYTITIRKEENDGEILYVGRVAEFPNISAFTETFEAAHALVLDSIQTLKKIADETKVEFPSPYPAPLDEFSGRVTLRLPKSLHAKISRIAAQEDISVNQYLVTAVAYYAGENDGVSKVVSAAVNFLGHIVSNAVTSAAGVWRTTHFILNDVITPSSLSSPSQIGGMPIIPTWQGSTNWPLLTGENHHG
ncbi:MAG: toxin-antitoxin system HicB family antitoxin [Gallionellaceae bacterium]